MRVPVKLEELKINEHVEFDTGEDENRTKGSGIVVGITGTWIKIRLEKIEFRESTFRFQIGEEVSMPFDIFFQEVPFP
jgi:hypothetical protein